VAEYPPGFFWAKTCGCKTCPISALENGCSWRTSTTLYDLGSHITIGNNVGIGEFAYLGGAGGLDIGDDCIVGQYFSCHPENHVFSDTSMPIRLQGITRKGIRIGKNCWIGAKVTILDGVTIGDNCVIAAGAVVTRQMPADSVIGGVPARVLKSTIEVKNVGGAQSHAISDATTRQAHLTL
jgi:acetyltransferase-like isoleucine patch superfamily enzyme